MGNGLSAALEVDPPPAKTTVSFQLNGEDVLIRDASPFLSLNDWLRSQPGLAGTKRMCEEGGCGCCVVAVSRGSSTLPNSGKIEEDSWDYVLPSDGASTIALNSVSHPVAMVSSYYAPHVVSVSPLCCGGMEHYNSGGSGEVSSYINIQLQVLSGNFFGQLAPA
jgi:xanthine dehydrogenase iron-sulfur cluster and FAD-binding subunit A